MSSVGIRDQLAIMKSKLESLEEELQKQLLDAEEKFQKMDGNR